MRHHAASRAREAGTCPQTVCVSVSMCLLSLLSLLPLLLSLSLLLTLLPRVTTRTARRGAANEAREEDGAREVVLD